MSKRNIFPVILALGLIGVVAFFVSSAILAGGGGPPQLCETGYDEIEGAVTWGGGIDICVKKPGDYVQYRYFDCDSCYWVKRTTSIYWNNEEDQWWYDIDWPGNACDVKVKGMCGSCSGCASLEHLVHRTDGSGTKILNLQMKYRCACQ